MKSLLRFRVAIAVAFGMLVLTFSAHAGSVVSGNKTDKQKVMLPFGKQKIQGKNIVHRFDGVLLNPQPLPPRWNPPWRTRLLNPQPLPPKWK